MKHDHDPVPEPDRTRCLRRPALPCWLFIGLQVASLLPAQETARHETAHQETARHETARQETAHRETAHQSLAQLAAVFRRARSTDRESRWRLPLPQPDPGHHALRIWVRNSALQYDTLTGCEPMFLAPAELRAMAPARPEVGAEQDWPRELFQRLAQACRPRGQVDARLDKDSIAGHVTCRFTGRERDTLRGVLAGELRLAPGKPAECGRRRNATCLYRSTLCRTGDCTVDARTGAILARRLVGEQSEFRWLPPFPFDPGPQHHLVGAELVQGAPVPKAAAGAGSRTSLPARTNPLPSKEKAR